MDEGDNVGLVAAVNDNSTVKDIPILVPQKSTLEQTKSKLTATGKWLQILSRYSQLQPALEALESGKPSHVDCPFHGGKDDFRFYADAFDSSRKSSKIAICSCGSFTAIDLIKKCEGVSRVTRDIVLMLESEAGIIKSIVPAPTRQPLAKKKNSTEEAVKWWNLSRPVNNEALVYLTNRGLPVDTLRLPKTLRYLPQTDYLVNRKCVYQGAALVAFLTRSDTSPAGIIRIFIADNGTKPLIESEGKQLFHKPMLKFADSLAGSALRIEGEKTGLEHVGEGVETMLAIRACVPDTVNACGTASLLNTWEPLPDTKRVVIWADNDENGTGQEAAQKLQSRLLNIGLTAVVNVPEHVGDDWLDVFNSDGGRALIAKNQKVPVYCFRKNPPPFLMPQSKSLKLDDTINYLNQFFVHVVHGGKNYVVRTGMDQTGRKMAEFFKLKDFVEVFSHWPETLVSYKKDGEPVFKNTGEAWLKNRNANVCYQGVTFYPVDADYYGDRLNTYYGFGFDPIACPSDDIQLWLDHVFNVICSADQVIYEYLLNWCAHMVQKPEEKPCVAVILKAVQGTGKGTFVDPLGQIMGSHYLYADNPEVVAGRFNGAMENKLLVFADEAFFGSKKATNKLKSKITEPYCTIERKGIDVIMVRDFSRIIMASNNDNIVHIEADERRYLYIEVSENKKQDLDYFKPLRDQIKSGYLAPRLLHFLKNRDISQFNPHNVPKTAALMDEKLDNLEPFDRFVYVILSNGEMVRNAAWPSWIPTEVLQDHFKNWADSEHLQLYGNTARKLGRALSKAGISRERKRNGTEREYAYKFPPLDDARAKFAANLNGDIDW